MSINITKLEGFIEENISSFHEKRIDKLNDLKLNNVLKRKNPYLFKAKNILTAGEFVKTILNAYLSSQEETVFGEFLENLAIFACSEVKGGYKSGIEGIDLEFNSNNNRYIVTIKSGPKWGNSSQINKMKDHFNKAGRILRTQNSNIHVVAVNGCCYGKEKNPDKCEYFKYCGQEFWSFITDDEEFYTKIIEPLGYKAKQKNDEFYINYAKVVNKFTQQFIDEYCKEDGSIDWDKIVKFNSKKDN